jgi:protein TonB
MSPRQHPLVVPLVAVVVSLLLHGLIAAAPLVLKRPARLASHLLQFDVVRRKPKPPAPPKRVERTKPKPKPRPRVQRTVEPPLAQPPERPEEVDPGPPPPPVFGATKESVTTGGASFAVPLGNTVATDPANRGPLKPGKPAPPAPPPPPPPPPPVRLRDKPRVLQEVRVPYPAKARALGVEGTVRLKVLVGPDGRVQQARVLEGPGFGLDEAARQALFRFRFQPAVGTDGRPMAHWITYRYTFQIDD